VTAIIVALLALDGAAYAYPAEIIIDNSMLLDQ
jgi:hypothetical protein